LKEKEKQQTDKKSKPYVKFLKRAIWPVMSLTLSIIIVLLLLYKPSGYISADEASKQDENIQLSQDITNRLLPMFYNGIQQPEPFEMVISENDINELIAQGKWPKYSEGFVLFAPKANIEPGKIGLMCTALQFNLDVELVVSAETKPHLDEEGLLNINVIQVKVGAMNITPLASFLARKMYQEQKPEFVDQGDWRSKVAASIFENAGFVPIFRIKKRWVRLEDLQIEQGAIRIRLKAVER
jgi:hypothetical protein